MKKRNLRIDGISLPALLCLVALTSQAQTVTTLATFTGPNGAYPWDALVQGTDGNFYGTTSGGIFKHQFYPGTAFKMTPDGTLTTIAELGRHRDSNTVAGLVQATNGYFYGAIQEGGFNRRGTIFAITPADELKTLYQFCQNGCTSEYPTATFIQALDGDLYSTAYSGGAIYKMTPGGALTFLHCFSGPDGALPWSGVIQAADGNFYGTTQEGGAPPAQNATVSGVFHAHAPAAEPIHGYALLAAPRKRMAVFNTEKHFDHLRQIQVLRLVELTCC